MASCRVGFGFLLDDDPNIRFMISTVHRMLLVNIMNEPSAQGIGPGGWKETAVKCRKRAIGNSYGNFHNYILRHNSHRRPLDRSYNASPCGACSKFASFKSPACIFYIQHTVADITSRMSNVVYVSVVHPDGLEHFLDKFVSRKSISIVVI